MGAAKSALQLDCLACFEKGFNLVEDDETKAKLERSNKLMKGNKFLRTALLGLSKQELLLNLSEDKGSVHWKATTASMLMKIEYGAIVLSTISHIKMSGTNGMIFVDNEGKAVFEVMAEDDKVRDQWVLALNEILDDFKANPDKIPKVELTAKDTSNKEEYFKKKEEELKQKEKENAERKKKYSAGGMKYTAQAMSRQGTKE